MTSLSPTHTEGYREKKHFNFIIGTSLDTWMRGKCVTVTKCCPADTETRSDNLDQLYFYPTAHKDAQNPTTTRSELGNELCK